MRFPGRLQVMILALVVCYTRSYANEKSAPVTTSTISHAEEELDPDTYVLEVKDTPKDFKIPTALWDKILNKESKEKKDEPLIVWLPVKANLTAKVSGILIQEKIQISLPRGGGTIDLSRITNGDRGTFVLKFTLNEFSNPSGMKVFFVSNSKKRRLEGDVYGSGCNVFLDVTSSVMKAQDIGGMKFNVTSNRHVSAMAGHFIFVQSEKDKVFLSQVEFTDSKNRDFLCKI